MMVVIIKALLLTQLVIPRVEFAIIPERVQLTVPTYQKSKKRKRG